MRPEARRRVLHLSAACAVIQGLLVLHRGIFIFTVYKQETLLALSRSIQGCWRLSDHTGDG